MDVVEEVYEVDIVVVVDVDERRKLPEDDYFDNEDVEDGMNPLS